jgi:hydrogenase/urease accessory protein HupE
LFLALQWVKHGSSVNIALVIMSLFMVAHGWAHGVELAGMNFSFIFGLLVMSTTVVCMFSVIGTAIESRLTVVSDA